jgi:hypothetical protein
VIRVKNANLIPRHFSARSTVDVGIRCGYFNSERECAGGKGARSDHRFFYAGYDRGDLAKAIKISAPGQPVVLLTAYAERFRSPAQPLSGIDSIIEKPVLIETFRETIANLSGS